MVRMSDPYPKRKCPAKWLSMILGFVATKRILAWVGAFAVSFTAREFLPMANQRDTSLTYYEPGGDSVAVTTSVVELLFRNHSSTG